MKHFNENKKIDFGFAPLICMAVCWISNIWFQWRSSNDHNDGAATPPCKNKATSQNQNRIQSRSRGWTQGRIRGGMRWRPKLNETPNPIQTNKHKFKRKLANANSKESKNEKRCFGFCHFVFAWRCTGLAMSDFSDFHSNEGAATGLKSYLICTAPTAAFLTDL